MEEIVNLFQSISQSNYKYLLKLSNALDVHQSFRYNVASSKIDTVIGYINTLLNSIDTRYEGVVLLRSFMYQCSLEILEQKGAVWIVSCTKICHQKKPANAISIAYEILYEIIKKSTEISDLQKSISTNYLSKIIESCVEQAENNHSDALQIIALALALYPGPCGSLRQTIQKFLFKFLDSTNQNLVIQAAKCQHLLQQIRGAGVQGVSHKNAWTQYHLQLIGSLHECLDLMFTHTTETFEGSSISERLNIPELKLAHEPVEKISQIVTRCGNLITYLDIMLIEPFPVSKSMHPAKVINLVSRGLEVNCLTISKNLISDNVALGALLPEIHIKLFNLINSLIAVLGTNLLIFSKEIIQIITQSLTWTSMGKSIGLKKPYNSIRIAAYDTLKNWCEMSKYGSNVENFSEIFINNIIQDITPFQTEVTLKVLTGSRKQMSKKARKKLHNAQNDASHLSQIHSNVNNTKQNYTDCGNENLCAKALECLRTVLESSGIFIKTNFHKLLQETIITFGLNIINSTNLLNNLYNSPECRINLFKVISCLISCCHHMIPPPIQYAVKIFNVAQILDSDLEVRQTAAEGLKLIEKILHPQKEFMYYANKFTDIEEAYSTEIKNVSLNDNENDSDVEFYEEMRLRISPSPESDCQTSIHIVEAQSTNDNSTKNVNKNDQDEESIAMEINDEEKVTSSKESDDDKTIINSETEQKVKTDEIVPIISNGKNFNHETMVTINIDSDSCDSQSKVNEISSSSDEDELNITECEDQDENNDDVTIIVSDKNYEPIQKKPKLVEVNLISDCDKTEEELLAEIEGDFNCEIVEKIIID